MTFSEGREELQRCSDAEEAHKRKHGDIFLNRRPVHHGERWMRQGRQKGLLQRVEKYDMVKDCERRLEDRRTQLALLDKYKLVRDFGRGRVKSAKLYS